MKKAALITFTSCFGCSFEFLNLRDNLLKVFEKLDFVDFKLVQERNVEGYDLVFIEGGISRKNEIPEIRGIRKRAKVLVALGACACNGCVMTLKNYRKDAEKQVYGKNFFGSLPVKGIDAYVKVDHYLRGCPFFRHELLSLVKSLLIGKKWKEKDYDVCMECRKRDNDCFLDGGEPCLGPISRAGCKAICPTNEYPCVGCRGLAEDRNLDRFLKVIREMMEKKDIKKKLEMYGLYDKIKVEEAWKKLK
ncbi:MAG: NADH:ubiquinone oxidoreductase [archaeon]|nr:MAG: NADH:ubiquinone oxidoreductase [archaeon]